MTNKNIAPSEVTDNVGDERGGAFRGIPKLRCLRHLEILSWDALGIPQLELLCLLNSFYITVSLNLKNDNVGDERGDAFRGIPKLSCLDIPWILTWGALGIPKLRVLSLLISSYRYLTQNLKTSTTQNLT